MQGERQVNTVVAIDGPAASGKSSVARRFAERAGFQHINSGLMYRAATRAVLDEGVDPTDAASVVGLLGDAEVRCELREGELVIWIAGRERRGLDEADVNEHVSSVAQVAEVRAVLVDLQRKIAAGQPTVMEGRDIGSVVFPDTPFKFYIDASEEVREARRRAQGFTDSVADRDRKDSTRASSPLVIPDDAVVIDSSELSVDEVVDRVLARVEQASETDGEAGGE